jgi:hypothetical protein
MSLTKAVIDYNEYRDSELGSLANIGHDTMTANAATFVNPPVTFATFLTQITAYSAAYEAKASRASADILAFNTARDTLEETLNAMGNFVNSLAKGDATIVSLSGLPNFVVDNTPNESPPEAPETIAIKHGVLPGTVLYRFKADRRPSGNEVQKCLGDPNKEADWQAAGLFRGGRVALSGLPPGQIVWFRARTMGLKGVMGAWSDPVQIRIL